MQREYLIFMQGEKSCGAAKLELAYGEITAEIAIDESIVLSPDCVLKTYLVLPESGKVEYLGVLEDHKGQYVLRETVAPIGIAVTVKSTDSGREEICCCCAEEGKIKEIEACFLGCREAETNRGQREEEKELPIPEVSESILQDKTYQYNAEEKLQKITEGYKSEKVNGFFLQRKTKILEYIMSNNCIYSKIMQYGYYLFFSKEENETEEYIIAVPSSRKEENPFENCMKYSFEICPDLGDGLMYYCIAAGKDSEGEFFRAPDKLA